MAEFLQRKREKKEIGEGPPHCGKRGTSMPERKTTSGALLTAV